MPRIRPPNPDLFMSPAFARAVETWSWADDARLEKLIAAGNKVMSTREDARTLKEMQIWLSKKRQMALKTQNIAL